MLSHVPQCTGESGRQNLLAQNVSSVQAEKLAFGLRVRGYEPGMAGIIAHKCMPESSGGGEAKTGRERMEARVKVVVLIQFRTWIQLHLKPVNCDSYVNKSF